MIERLTREALEKIIEGKVKKATKCVITFYNNRCHYCHKLKPIYADIAQRYTDADTLFFAFNAADHPSIEEEIGIRGVPSFCVVVSAESGALPDIAVMPNVAHPDKETYYNAQQVEEFVKEGKFSDDALVFGGPPPGPHAPVPAPTERPSAGRARAVQPVRKK